MIMAMHKSSSHDDGMMAEINITPLVDVMLVLLVIFIITAPLIVPQSIKVTLPNTEALAQQDQANNAQLQVSADGQISLEGQTMSLTQLGVALRERSTQPNFQLQVLADERVAYGVVAKVMAVAQSNGANKLSFVTLPN
jgi:biopolymer transport protein ExbD